MTSEEKIRKALEFAKDAVESQTDEEAALLDDALSALHSIEAEKEPEWISCEERLPTSVDADSEDSVWWACYYPEDDEDPWFLTRESWTTPDDACYWTSSALRRPAPPEHKPE